MNSRSLLYCSYLLIVFCLLNSCSSDQMMVIWVNSLQVDCEADTGSKKCLMVSSAESLDSVSWEKFHSSIEGFEFEEGYYYRLEVSRKNLRSSESDNDKPMIQYSLLNILEKKKDDRWLLNDNWYIDNIQGRKLDKENEKARIEFNIAEMQAVGHDGCNNFLARIKSLTDTEITLPVMAATKKMCPNMEVPDLIGKLLPQVEKYNIEGQSLTMSDSKGIELLVFLRSKE